MKSMDLSSLSEEQQQQLEKLQKLFQEHQREQEELEQKQQQEQQQQQQLQLQQHYQPNQFQDFSYQYDPSQSQSQIYVNPTQAYDQSSQAYYQYYYQQQHGGGGGGGVQNYDYIQQDYANAYQQHHQQAQAQPIEPQLTVAEARPTEPQETVVQPVAQVTEAQLLPIYPPRVPVSQEKMAQMDAGAGKATTSAESHQQNSTHPQQRVVEGQSSAYPGLSPAAAAAVAALSQLAEFAGTMGLAERALAVLQGQQHWPGPGMAPASMRPLVNQSPYMVANGSGARAFKGRHRGMCGSHPPFNGSVRGRGQSRDGRSHFARHGPSSYSNPGSSVSEEAENSAKPAETTQDGEPQDSTPQPAVTRKAAPEQKPPHIHRCDVCKVECNSVEILEQHKNGKKHKKNLQKLGQLKDTSKTLGEMGNAQDLVANSNKEGTLQLKNGQGGDNSEAVSGNLPTEETAAENNVEAQQQTDAVGQSASIVVSEVQNQKLSMKRKMKSGPGGKRMRMEPRAPKIVVPFMCDLCNVKCDTQEVFNRHLSGKKHLSKIKQFEGHHAMYGPDGLQALYPPNPISQAFLHPPQLQDNQHMLHGLQQSYPQPVGYPVQPVDPAAAMAATVSVMQYHQTYNPQA